MRQDHVREVSATSRAAMIDWPPENMKWYYGEWQPAYATLVLVNLRFEEGLPNASLFDPRTRNLVVVDDMI